MLSTLDKFGTVIQFSLENIKAIYYYLTEIHIEYFGEKENVEIQFDNKETCEEFSDTLMSCVDERNGTSHWNVSRY